MENDQRVWLRAEEVIGDRTKAAVWLSQAIALVRDLMEARGAVKEAKTLDDKDKLHAARAAVDLAKVALEERGPVWWDDGSPDFNRHKAINTPYAEWYRSLPDL